MFKLIIGFKAIVDMVHLTAADEYANFIRYHFLICFSEIFADSLMLIFIGSHYSDYSKWSNFNEILYVCTATNLFLEKMSIFISKGILLNEESICNSHKLHPWEPKNLGASGRKISFLLW